MSVKVSSVKLKNFCKFDDFTFDKFTGINLIIGENGTGKTVLLKALYSALRTLEEYHRGDDIRSANDILADKLRWTFQTDKLGDLVNRDHKDDGLVFDFTLNDTTYGYQFSKSAMQGIVTMTDNWANKGGNSIFIPAKEVLSLYSIILKSRDIDKAFGFDDTYYDLVKALNIAPSVGKNFTVFSQARKMVDSIIDGKVDYDKERGKWYYKNNKGQKFTIGATSEGVKKIAIMDRLFGNGYLDDTSVIFIDEIDSALHPEAICKFLDMIAFISQKMGIQFFISSHSYFVIKKCALLALNNPEFITCISLNKNGTVKISDMHNGMPDNSIIDTSIAIYEQEIAEVLS